MNAASTPDAIERTSAFNSLRLEYFKADVASLAIAEEVQTAEATDDEINALLDTSEEPSHGQESPTDKPKVDVASIKFFLTAILLSKVIRNNELLDNEELKTEAVSKAIDAWCYFASEGNFIFTKLGKGEGPPEALEKFSALGDKEKALVEFVLKCMVPVIVEAIAFDALGTEKLYVVLRRAYDQIEEENLLRRFTVLSVLMYVGFSMSPVPKDVIDRARDFIKGHITTSIALVLSIILYTFYMNPFLGDNNRRKVEELMLEIRVKMEPGPAANKKREALKGGLAAQLLRLRQGNDELDEGQDRSRA